MPNLKKLLLSFLVCLPFVVQWLKRYPNEPRSQTDSAMGTRRAGRSREAPPAANRGRSDVATLPRAEMAAFEGACLKVHNNYRAMHGCPPLKLQPHLSQLATDWALVLAKRNKMEHRPNNDDYGENIYYSEGLAVNAAAAVKMWYDEIDLYNFAAGKFSFEAGHFTQLIWRDTKELGVGVATRGNKVWVVANYEPPGNFQGEFKENVPRTITSNVQRTSTHSKQTKKN